MTLLSRKLRSKALLFATISTAALGLTLTNFAIAQESAPEAAAAEAAASKTFSEAQKTEIQAIFKDYLLENPELIAEAMTALRAKQEREMEEMAKAKLSENAGFFQSDALGSTGNPEGDVTVVEFLDYNCGYCKKAFEDVQGLLDTDKNVKIVFVEMPILGPTSLTAAQWALAAKEQGKYFEFHTALMEFQGNKDEAALTKIAQDLELDIEKMKADAAGDKVQDTINKSVEIARDMGIQGTPAFIVGDQIFRGYIGTDALIESVKEERS